MQHHHRILTLTVAIAAASSLALAPTPAAAQRTTVEISPFAGYRWDGQLDEDAGLFNRTVDVDQSELYGVRLGFVVTDAFQVEIEAQRQPTRFTRGGALFGPNGDLADVDIDSLEVGFLFQGGDGQVHPFGVFGIGTTRLSPDLPGVDSESRLSASAGGGVKVFLNPHIGLRFEGRVHWTDTDDSQHWWSDHDLYQKEVTAGLIFAF